MLQSTKEFIQRRLPEAEADVQLFLNQEIGALQKNLYSSPYPTDNPASFRQMGYLVGLMDLEKPDRIELLSALLGFDLEYTQDLPGTIEVNSRRRSIGEPSFMDVRVTSWMANVLISYFKDDPNAQDLIDTFGYTRASVIESQAVAQRKADRQAQAAARQLAAEQRRAERQRRKEEKATLLASKPERRSRKSPDLVGSRV